MTNLYSHNKIYLALVDSLKFKPKYINQVLIRMYLFYFYGIYLEISYIDKMGKN